MNTKKVAWDVLSNFPEAAICVEVVGWKGIEHPEYGYGYSSVTFIQEFDSDSNELDEPVEVEVTPAALAKSVNGFCKMWKDKGWNYCGADYKSDEGWDACVYDSLIQYHLYGDVILG
jgi:hypothetical protein